MSFAVPGRRLSNIAPLLTATSVVLMAFMVMLMLGDPAHGARYASIVMDADTGQVIYSRHANSQRYPASLTKMMTLYLTFKAVQDGKVRLEHPTALRVRSGRRSWDLTDITLTNPKLASDWRAAAAEFELTPLLSDLQQDRPLRLELPGVFVELPVPPYVVAEWRSLTGAAG